MKKYILLSLGLILGSLTFAQNSMWSVSWDMGLPVNATKEFSDDFSLRGLTVDGRYSINNSSFSLGGNIGWNVFYEKREKDILTTGNTTIYGTQWRYDNNLPIFLTGSYVYGNHGKVQTFAGLGVGTIWTERRLEIGVYNYTQSNWQFALAPEVGVVIPLGNNVNAIVKAKYSHGFNTKTMDGTQYFSFSLGLCWTDYSL